MVDGVLGHLGHHAVEHVVAETNQEEDHAIIHHQDMAGQVAMVQVMTRRDVILIVAQVSVESIKDFKLEKGEERKVKNETDPISC